MTTYTFRAYPAQVSATFDCPSCGKKKRKRTFRHECTVNPFNKNEDGTIKTAVEVARQSLGKAKQEREEFLREPMCATCENALSWKDRAALRGRRKQVQP